MAKVLFVDDRPNEILRLWNDSGCESEHTLLPVEVFISVEQTHRMITRFQPDIILVGYGLSNPEVTGADVVSTLRKEGYAGHILANSGGGTKGFDQAGVIIDGNVERSAKNLVEVLKKLFPGREQQ